MWTKPDTLQFKWKNDRSSQHGYTSGGKIHIFVFPIESAQHVTLFL